MSENINFDEYFDEASQQTGELNDVIQLDDYKIQEFCMRLSGKNDNGKNKSKLSYTSYVVKNDDFENLPQHNVININNAEVNIYPNRTLPDFYTIDLVFPRADLNEIKLLWLKLEKYKKDNLLNDFDTQSLFVLQVIENFDENDLNTAKNRLYCNILNPLLFYLTRSTPNMLSGEVETEEGPQGGNIVRLLCHSDLVSFDVLEDMDINAVKEEIAYEEEIYADAEKIAEAEIKRIDVSDE